MAPTIESPLPTMAPTATPKGMSSRLMTMKFMQRAEASARSSPATTPKTENEGSAKRRKTSHQETPDGKPLYDEKAVQAALEEEETKRQAAIARRAKELGDEQWVLAGAAVAAPNAKQRASLNYVQVGFAQIDSGFPSDDEDDSPGPGAVTGLAGRRQFNMKKKGKKRAAEPESDSDSGSGSSGSGDESGSEQSSSAEADAHSRGRQSQPEGTPSGSRKRHSHSVSKRREAERIKAQELAEKRRKKEVKLNTLNSLSSGGASASAFGGKGSYTGNMQCFSCGNIGHSKANCPSRRKSGS